MKLLLSDLDGTLLFNDIGIKEEDLNAIHRFQAKGHLFGINTGRTLVGLYNGIGNYPLHPDIMILSSGSQICDKQHHYLFNQRISRDVIEKIANTIDYQDKAKVLLCNGTNYYHHLDLTQIKDLDFDSLHFSFKNISDLLTIKAQFEREFKGLLEPHQNVLHLDLSSPGTNKGNAIIKASELFQIPLEDIACIGDSFNDLSMFEVCKTSFTFETSDDILKQKATYIVSSIAEAIERLEE